MPVVTPENRERILREAEEGARLAARQLGTTKKAEKEGEGYVPMTALEIRDREEERVTRRSSTRSGG